MTRLTFLPAVMVVMALQPVVTDAVLINIQAHQSAQHAYVAAEKANDRARDAEARASRASAVGTVIRSGFIAETDFNTDLRGERWHGTPTKLGIADKMLRDPHVRQSIEYIAGPLCSARWSFIPVSKDPLDREVADYLTYGFFERLPWRKNLRRIVQRYAAHGFALEELNDDNLPIPRARFPLHPGKGIGLLPVELNEIEPRTVYRWWQDKQNAGKVAKITQRIVGSDVETAGFPEITSDRFVRFTWDQDGADFRGVAVLRTAYPPWKLKQAFQTLDAIRHERLAVPTAIVYGAEDSTDEDLDAAEKILAEMRSHEKGSAAFPHGYKFEWASGGGSDQANIEVAIERCNKDIAINVSAGYMLLGLTGKSGSYALGTTQQTQHHVTVEGHAHFIADGLTFGSDNWSAAERMVRANYGDGVHVPRAVAKNMPTRDWAAIAKVTGFLAQTGVITPDDELEDETRESMQLGPRDPATARKPTPSNVAPDQPPGTEPKTNPGDEPTPGEDEQRDQNEGLTSYGRVVV